MNGLNTFIGNCQKATGIEKETCDTVIQSMVRAINNGVLGGTNYMSQMVKLKKKKFTTINSVSDVVAEDTGLDRNEIVKPVVGWMVDIMIQTMQQGGMPALIRMVNLMKKGQQSQTKEVDYSEEIKDINNMLDKGKKKDN